MSVGYTFRMTKPDLTKTGREELVNWIRSGFREYADLCGYWEGKIHRTIRAQIFKYGNEFGRILRGKLGMSEEDDPQALRTDLYGLMKSGCPALALVELMLAGTSDQGVTISDLLFQVEIRDEHLGTHEFEGLHQLTESKLSHVSPRSSRSGYNLALYYLLLKHFGYGHETMRLTLRAMQRVRQRVPPRADYLRTRGRDHFTGYSLQRRIHRFFKSFPKSKRAMQKDIREYLSAPTEARKTLLGVS